MRKMLAKIWQRAFDIRIGNICISSGMGVTLDAKFSVEKTDNREPNKCMLSIYKLSDERSDSISRADQVEIIAGYQGFTAVLFVGDIDDVWSDREDGDRVTIIRANDSGRSYRRTQVHRSFGPDTTIVEVLRYVVGEMGIGVGNLSDFEDVSDRDNSPDFFENGFNCSGFAYRVLDNLILSKGLTWSVQDGVLQIQRRNIPLRDSALVINENTGLIGSPTRDLGKQTNRRNQTNMKVNCDVMLIPGLYIGRVVRLESLEITGNYQIKKVSYTGHLHGREWDASLVLEEY
jgi:hypothetical protein